LPTARRPGISLGPLRLISLEEVDVKLWGATLLAGITFELRKGESWALLGGNGAGKSTFLRLLRGDVWPHPGSRGRRLYWLDGGPEESPIGARERIALVSAEAQDAYLRHEWNLRAEDVVRTGFAGSIWLDSPLTAEQERRVEEAIGLLGLDALRDKPMPELSNGETRKVLLARALAPRPRVLLLDEFCNGLDARSRRDLLQHVSGIALAGTPIVLATHRCEELVPEVTKGAILEGGRMVAQGSRQEILGTWAKMTRNTTTTTTEAATAAPATTAAPTKAYSPSDTEGRRAAACPPLPRRGTSSRPTSFDGVPDERGANGRILIDVEDADALVDGVRVLRGITWRMRQGENWVVRGPNGAGKSTLLRLIAGDQHPAPGGRVRRLDLGERASIWDVKSRIGLVTPLLQADHRYDICGLEVIHSGFFASIGIDAPPSPEDQARAERWIDRLGVRPLVSRRIHSLSYGELRKLLVVRAMVRNPEVLLLDEPFNGLDAPSRSGLTGVLEELCAAGTHLVLVTHHDEEVLPSVNRVLDLAGGRIMRQGPRGSDAGAGL
jgi:molybdate transport system ATP-binding protein